MLIQLTSDDASKNWDKIYSALCSRLGMDAEDKESSTNILVNILSGRAQLWLLSREGTAESIPIMLGLTTISVDAIWGKRSLFIYAVEWLSSAGSKDYLYGLRQLEKYARAQGCTEMFFYSRDDKLKCVMKRLGADVEYTLVRLEVPNVF